jgi:hypothetical protein
MWKLGRGTSVRTWAARTGAMGVTNIETAFSMIKGKFGSSLRSKSDTGQINEALCKVLAHTSLYWCRPLTN